MDRMTFSQHLQTDTNNKMQKPTAAFVGASWCTLLIGISAYIFGLWNASMQLNEKGYYFAILMLGLFSAISLQKSVRDRAEEVPVTHMYSGIYWASLGIAITLLVVGLWNATLELSEKGFYGISFLLCLFASVTVQKNVRDLALFPAEIQQVEIQEEEAS